MTVQWIKTARAFLVSLGIGLFSNNAVADSGPIVVELYTSQGCSSCPPADALLEKLASRADVLPLGLHVDYWDYIGWADEFADPAFGERQRNYARAIGKRMVYTPQMIIAGEKHVVGNVPADVEASIKTAAAFKSPVSIKVSRSVSSYEVEVQSTEKRNMVIQLVQFEPMEKVQINRGENAGRQISYANIVTDWQDLKKWNGAKPAKIKVQASGGPFAVIIQSKGQRRILASARLD